MEPKTRRVYKGEELEIKDLDLTSGPVVIQVMDASRGAVGSYGRLPQFAIVERLSAAWSPAQRTIAYVDGGNPAQQFNRELPAKSVVKRLTGTHGAKIAAEYKAWRAANVETAVRHLAMTVGCDPEVFVVDKAGDVIPAWNFLGAKPKSEPPGSLGVQYWDGFQAEFTVYGTTCLAHMLDYTQRGLRMVHEAATGHKKGAKLSLQSVLPVPRPTLESADPKYVEFGCAPSLNIYGMHGNQLPGREVPMRFAGGHLHFGCAGTVGKGKPEALGRVIKALDAILGVSCVSLFAAYDNPVRREYYGLPGEYRLPAHGIEYRTLSNAWLSHPVIANLVFDLGRRALAYGVSELDVWDCDEDTTINIIKTHDVDGAREVLTRNKKVWTAILSGNPAYVGSASNAHAVFLGGMDSVIKKPEDIAGNWDLTTTWQAHCDGPAKNWRLALPIIKTGGKV